LKRAKINTTTNVTIANANTAMICRRLLAARCSSSSTSSYVLGFLTGGGSGNRTGRPHRQRAMSPTLSVE
jgi:hypothetical protein